MEVFHGRIVYSKNPKELVELESGYIVVKDGLIWGVFEELPKEYKKYNLTDFGRDVIIPAFTDLHVHAPQYPNRGIATDALLSDWLNKYTFPLEKQYEDYDFAHEVYFDFMDSLFTYGTMHAVIFATIHNKSTDLLLRVLEGRGFLSYVGKVSMDKSAPDYLIEDTEEALKNEEAFLKKHSKNRFSKPILTPRFAPTCSKELLEGLGELARKYQVGMQTHIEESLWEKEQAKADFPEVSCDMEIYQKAGLLFNNPVIAAHFIFPDDKDIQLLKECNGIAVQCPDATTNVIAGIMDTGGLMDKGVRVGMGSDISAGSYLGMFRQVAAAVRLSKIKSFYEPEVRQITFEEAFHNATLGGGSLFGKVGTFARGYDFDALVIRGLEDKYKKLSPREVIERFCYNGDITNIKYRFHRGKSVK